MRSPVTRDLRPPVPPPQLGCQCKLTNRHEKSLLLSPLSYVTNFGEIQYINILVYKHWSVRRSQSLALSFIFELSFVVNRLRSKGVSNMMEESFLTRDMATYDSPGE
jgi:hypothetical protein